MWGNSTNEKCSENAFYDIAQLRMMGGREGLRNMMRDIHRDPFYGLESLMYRCQ